MIPSRVRPDNTYVAGREAMAHSRVEVAARCAALVDEMATSLLCKIRSFVLTAAEHDICLLCDLKGKHWLL